MNILQLIVLVAASFSLISWTTAEGIVSREYLPVAVGNIVTQRKFLHYPSSYYKPYYNQYPQTHYPQYTSSYYPQYKNGFLDGYHQQQDLKYFTPGTSLGLNGLGLGGYYPNLNVDLLTTLKPRVDVIDTVYDANGGYVYGKKK